jgi:hypothetical protein
MHESAEANYQYNTDRANQGGDEDITHGQQL